MTWSLVELEACFEGVIPSIISTADADGIPNISYLSHVAIVDDHHVALSNQFFAKTAANIRLNPQATLLVVDGHNGAQFRLDLRFAYSMESGPLFDSLALQVEASSAQAGMADVMRLRHVDVFRVLAIVDTPSPVATPARRKPERSRLDATRGIVERIAAAADVDGIVDATLDGIRERLGFYHGLFLHCEPDKTQVVAIGSIGYTPSGIGAEVPLGEGLIGAAAGSGKTVKVSDMSRIRRFGSAIRATTPDENRTRSIPLPGMAEAMSQIAVPLLVQDAVEGVLFFESAERLAFGRDDEAALAIIARQAAASLALCERLSLEGESAGHRPSDPPAGETHIDVVHHRFDDSVFVNGDYVIKGVAGRLLVFMVEQSLASGRREFSNREIRLDTSLRLPDFKDNLETRLLLLRRRLEEKMLPVRLIRLGRGKIGLEIDGSLRLTRQ
ncbi:MAG: GAF domain-containing protein [Alphaproteobacteria bacterium]|nr:GAF domain-containing protein [Rhizobiaceae bacterium]MBU3961326.1 GAF domain-containing protein [Alphaproteobacteria bacterium]MBU4052208.1 GAF domain-containing protein [Alphaproteobacteria bacterium]MBU4087538.1 GAF domain-containing protein [Alphaproteobacteria bacterium]MBU4157669.1 GAF domain-containing protein [Alphaproteobacteria bacterium]